MNGQFLAAVLVPSNDMTDVVQFFHQMQKLPSEFQFFGNAFRTPKQYLKVTPVCTNSLMRCGQLKNTYIRSLHDRNTQYTTKPKRVDRFTVIPWTSLSSLATSVATKILFALAYF